MFNKIASIIGILALMIASSVLTGYIIKTKPSVLGLSARTSTPDPQAQINDVVGKVSKLMDLPKDETPTVAIVTDASKINAQSFFKNARNDDRILIYSNAQKAILYRPSANIIVEVGYVSINQAQASPSATPKAK